MDALVGCAVVMLLETGIILVINRYLPFLLRLPAGKERAGKSDICKGDSR